MSEKRVTADRLRELLSYDPSTGLFTWLLSTGNRAPVGAVAGSVGKGYVDIRIDQRLYKAHRLAWLYMTGEWPEQQIDHRDLNRANNRWDNLRVATNSQNHANTRAQSNNRSGFKGVSWSKAANKWMAQIVRDRCHTYLGLFDTPEDAHAAYCVAAERLFGEFARAV